LDGDCVVRLVYLDEAGIGDIAKERQVVVTGAIIDADKQWKRLEEYYRTLAEEVFPSEDTYRFVFHAKDIWHGSGAFDGNKFSRRDRQIILRRLAQVPTLFQIPIACAAVDRVAFSQQRSFIEASRKVRNKERTARLLTHAYAFVSTVHAVDYWMQRYASVDEVAMLIAEDTAQVKSTFERLHEAYTLSSENEDDESFRTQKIVDSVHFAKKRDSILLQMADHCAFILGRTLAGHADMAELYKMIKPQLRDEVGQDKKYSMLFPASHLDPV
jgi:uncharacterized protein DUF3800